MQKQKKLFALSLAALGVVFGDIGTSPLYSVKEIFFGHGHLERTPEAIYGAIGLIIWTLTLVVSVKYILFVLRADFDGEGGVFALFGLLHKKKTVVFSGLGVMLLFAAGLLYGDGVITPAISVISAIEGLKIATSSFENLVVPLTVIVLTLLFAVQSKGTARIGRIVGPLLCIWFLVIAWLGLRQLLLYPAILQVFDPRHVYWFVTERSIMETLRVLGSVMLVITGGEAMYADLGHFGVRPIRWSWFSLVYPALILNYLGQGAYLLSGQEVLHGSVFYALVPSHFIIPMVVLATIATVIASQALISGAFSLTAQGMALGLFPYLKTIHTHDEHEGQIYISRINWALYTGCVTLVLLFQTSTRLAGAYGLAVSGVMLSTTIAMGALSFKLWRWPLWKAIIVFIPFALLDLLFVAANSLKFLSGGFVPFLIAIGILLIISAWVWGKRSISKKYRDLSSLTIEGLIKLKKSDVPTIPVALFVMNRGNTDHLQCKVPSMQLFWEHYHALPQDIVLVHIDMHRVPHASDTPCQIHSYFAEEIRGTILTATLNFGFMDEPKVEKVLLSLHDRGMLPITSGPHHWLVQVVHERIMRTGDYHWAKRLHFFIFSLLHRNADRTYRYFGLGHYLPLTMDIVTVQMR